MIEWNLKADSYGNCNCAYNCPCQFEMLPTQNSCQGFEIFRVNEGRFGDVDLAGVTAAVFYSWPGPIFEGGGTTQTVIDSSASPQQRDAIERIVKGEEIHEAGNHWWVFNAMSDTVLETLFLPIDFVMDMNARTTRISIPGYLEATGEPIANPHDGGPHRVQIRCPEGIEFDVAEVGNGNSEVTGGIRMKLENSYGQWNLLDHSNNGPAHVQ